MWEQSEKPCGDGKSRLGLELEHRHWKQMGPAESGHTSYQPVSQQESLNLSEPWFLYW